MRLGAARSLALIAGSRPLSGNANESPPAAASVLGPWLLLQRSLAPGGSPGVRRPAGSRLFVPAGTEPEFRL
jgi:hypothetical protein